MESWSAENWKRDLSKEIFVDKMFFSETVVLQSVETPINYYANKLPCCSSVYSFKFTILNNLINE